MASRRRRRRTTADEIARAAAATTLDAAPPESAHEAWLRALGTPDGVVEWDGAELARLADAVREWRRPVAAATDAPFRLCFRLEEPPLDEDGPRGPWSVRYLLQSRRDPSLPFPPRRPGAAERGTTSARSGPAREPARPLVGGGRRRVRRACRRGACRIRGTDAHGAHLFLTESAAALEQAASACSCRRGGRQGTRLRLGVRAQVRSPKMKESGAGVGLEELVHVDWQIALGDETLTLAELQALARMKEPLVRVRGQWVHMTAEEIRAALDLWRKKEKTAPARDLLRMALGAVTAVGPLPIEGVQATGWVGEVLARLEGHVGFQDLPPPSGLAATLRPYQQRGYSWLAFLKGWGLGACLADDMGLGKTIQTLSLLLAQRNGQGPALVVCPTSVMGNWQREAERFTPGLRALVHHGVRRGRGEALREDAARHDLVITSYALLLRDLEHLLPVAWSAVILDEARTSRTPRPARRSRPGPCARPSASRSRARRSRTTSGTSGPSWSSSTRGCWARRRSSSAASSFRSRPATTPRPWSG
jgi:hypothetical protein